MPGQNGTGPQGCGPMTGRRLGVCSTGEKVNQTQQESQVAAGGGFCRCGQFLRRGFGGGRGGFGNRGRWQ